MTASLCHPTAHTTARPGQASGQSSTHRWFRLLFCSLSLFLAATAASAEPFTGRLLYVLSRLDPHSAQVLDRQRFEILVSPDGIVCHGLDQFWVHTGPGATALEKIYLRHRGRDVLIQTSPYRAYRFRSLEMQLVSRLLQQLPIASLLRQMPSPEYGGRFLLRGDEVEKWTYQIPGSVEEIQVFLTTGSSPRIQYGFLAEPWLFGSEGLEIPGLRRFLEQGRVPARISLQAGKAEYLRVDLLRREPGLPEEDFLTPPETVQLYPPLQVVQEWLSR